VEHAVAGHGVRPASPPEVPWRGGRKAPIADILVSEIRALGSILTRISRRSNGPRKVICACIGTGKAEERSPQNLRDIPRSLENSTANSEVRQRPAAGG
jgi:hypothetical protein